MPLFLRVSVLKMLHITRFLPISPILYRSRSLCEETTTSPCPRKSEALPSVVALIFSCDIFNPKISSRRIFFSHLRICSAIFGFLSNDGSIYISRSHNRSPSVIRQHAEVSTGDSHTYARIWHRKMLSDISKA